MLRADADSASRAAFEHSEPNSGRGAPRRVALVGVPSALGGPPLGSDRGPADLRGRGLLDRLQAAGHDAIDYGDVVAPHPGVEEPATPDAIEAIVRRVAGQCRRALAERRAPLVLGGDHSISIGSIAASAQAEPALGILWLDAHADFNTPETSPSGNLHGMVLAVAAGLGPRCLTSLLLPAPMVAPPRIAVVGARCLDRDEVRNLRRAGLRVFDAEQVRRQGMRSTVRQAMAYLLENGVRSLHVSVDLDLLDPDRWPGVSTPEPGGISLEDLGLAVRCAAASAPIVALDIVELTPPRDREGATAEAAIAVIEWAMQGRAGRWRVRRRGQSVDAALPPAA